MVQCEDMLLVLRVAESSGWQGLAKKARTVPRDLTSGSVVCIIELKLGGLGGWP